MEASVWATVWTVSAVWWQWLLAIAVALWVWEMWLENVWYKFKHWVTKTPHSKTQKWSK